MNSSPSVAGKLSNDARKALASLSLSKAEPIAHLADREGVSRQFLYRQKQKAVEALDEAFAAKDDDVLFYLPVNTAITSKVRVQADNRLDAIPRYENDPQGAVQRVVTEVFGRQTTIH
jgi:hypothetical protein